MTDQLFDPAAVLELLKARYPVFQDCRPLAIGTGPTLVAAAADLGLSKKTIRRKRPKPVKKALARVERLEPSMVKIPPTAKRSFAA